MFEFMPPFISVLAIRVGQNKQREFALMSMCPNIWQFQPYSSHPFSDEGWDLGRHRAPLAPTDFIPLLGLTPSSVTSESLILLFSVLQGKTMFSVACLSRIFSITNNTKRNGLKCCPPSLKCQGFGPAPCVSWKALWYKETLCLWGSQSRAGHWLHLANPMHTNALLARWAQKQSMTNGIQNNL